MKFCRPIGAETDSASRAGPLPIVAAARHPASGEPARAPGSRPMPVLLPAAARLTRTALRERREGAPAFRLAPSHGMALLVAFVVGCGIAEAQSAPTDPSILETLWKWTPLLARGFVFNLAISFLAMAIGTLAGFFLGFAQISLVSPVRKGAFLATHFFRNASSGCCRPG